MYNSIYTLLNELIFNGSALSGSFIDQSLTIVSLAFCLGLVALPFKLCLGFINIITDWRRI